MADVTFTDGDVVFEDEDVIWDKLGTSLTIQNANHGVVCDEVVVSSLTELAVLDSVHGVRGSYLNIIATPADTSDVYWEDSPIEFEDLDLEFVPKQEGFSIQGTEHGLSSTQCSLTSQIPLTVTSPSHALFSVEQNVTLSGEVTVTDSAHGISGTHSSPDTSKSLVVHNSDHSLVSTSQNVTLLTELSVVDTDHGISGTHPFLVFSAPPEQVLVVKNVVHRLTGEEVGITGYNETIATNTVHGLVSAGAVEISTQLSVNNSSHGMTVGTPNIALDIEMTAVDIVFVMSLSSPFITADSGVEVNDLEFGVTSESPSLTGDFQCTAQDTEHGLVSGVADFTSKNELSVTDSVLEISVTPPTIVGSKILSAQSANHSLFTAEQLLNGDLQVSGIATEHGIAGDISGLTANALIYAVDTEHGLISDSPSVSGQELVVASPAHGMVVDVPTLGQRKLKENFTAIQRPYLVVSNSDEYFYTGRDMTYHYITKKAA